MRIGILVGLVAPQSFAFQVRGITPAALERADQRLTGWVDLQCRSSLDERRDVMVDRIEAERQAIVGLYVYLVMLFENLDYGALVGLGAAGSGGVGSNDNARNLREPVAQERLESLLHETLGTHTLLAEFGEDLDPAVIVLLPQDHG